MAPKLRLYFHTPVPIFKAQVNLASATYPIAQIPFDNVTLGAFGDIEFDMTLVLGTTDGADDLGRVRVNKPATSSLINIARSGRGVTDGTLDVQDNAYITIYEDFRVWAKIPFFDIEGGIDFKDGDISPGSYNTNIPPKANCGPGTVDYINSGSGLITVQFPRDGVNTSFAVAEGATIATHNWDVKDGTITTGTASDPVISATFPAGFRYVAYTVTDSNGTPHTMRCPVLAIDPDDDVSFRHFQATQKLERTGQTLDVELFGNLSRTFWPDGTLVIFWWDRPESSGDRSHIKFIGWIDNEGYSVRRNKRGLTKGLTFHCIDINGRLEKLPGFPQALERQVVPSLWSHMPDLDIHKSLYYLGFWHSTAFNIADLVMPDNLQDYDAMRLDASGASLFEQIHSQAMKIVPDHYLTCNAQGQLEVRRDWRLDDVGDRPASAPIVTVDNWNDLSVEYNRHPKVHVLRSASIEVSTDFVVIDDEETVPVVQSIAPSDAQAFGQGTNEVQESEGLALSQAALNKETGHRFAMLNSRFGPFTWTDPTGFEFWDCEPALMNRVQINIPQELSLYRPLPFTQASGMVTSIAVQYRTTKMGTVVKPTITWEKEEAGYPAVTFVPDEAQEDDEIGVDPVHPPDFGIIDGQDMLAGIAQDGHVYRTTDFQTASGLGGPTWDEVDLGITEAIFSWVVDPFSPGYISGSGTINGWIATETDIYRVEDLFGTPSATSVHTFAAAVNFAGLQNWRSIQCSFGAFFEENNPWLLCISHYDEGGAGKSGTWALRSLDGGLTWEEEVYVSPKFDTTTFSRHHPVPVYCSPRTPGLAYTTAIRAMYYDSPYTGEHMAQVGAFRSTDWGETWEDMSEVADLDPLGRMPKWGTGVTAGPVTITAAMPSVYMYFGAGPGEEVELVKMIIPPADAVRVVLTGMWFVTTTDVGGLTDPTFDFDRGQPAIIDRTIDTLSPTHPGDEGTSVGGYTMEFTRVAGTDWPVNLTSIVSSPPADFGGGCWLRMEMYGGSPGRTIIGYISLNASEIELEDGTKYYPGEMVKSFIEPLHHFGGSMHIPWASNTSESLVYYGQLDRTVTANRKYDLMQNLGLTQTDISPNDGTRPYGIARYGFSVRAYDSDRRYMVMAGTGNETDPTPTEDKHAVYVSSDFGASWTQIVAPVDDGDVALNMGAFEAAFSGDNPDVIFIWGPAGYISYTDDFGATVDDRSGNLAALGSVAWIGIAGGPTG